ncbi:MAG TPA: VOC family protein, partial [Dysgonomonas sp.]|nr:VOC family protein [Dysgonomonas sp.]
RSLEAENKEEADKLYSGLSQGGIILMPLAIAHWGDYFGMFTDKFGINWQINLSRDKE